MLPRPLARAAPAASRLLAYAPAPLASLNAHLGEWVGGEYVYTDIPTARGRPLARGGGDLHQGRGLRREEYALVWGHLGEVFEPSR